MNKHEEETWCLDVFGKFSLLRCKRTLGFVLCKKTLDENITRGVDGLSYRIRGFCFEARGGSSRF